MRDSIDDDDIDRAYRTAVDTSTDVAGVRRRRAAVLEAVERLDAVHATPVQRQGVVPDDRAAANAAHRHPSATWWRGVAAACVVGISSLVVVHMQQMPQDAVETAPRPQPGRVAAPAPSGAAAADRVAQAAPRKDERVTAPAPPDATAVVADARPRAPAVPAAAPAGLPPSMAANPTAKTARSAFPGDGIDNAVSNARAGQSGAAGGTVDAAPREPARAAWPPAPVLGPDLAERQERSASRSAQPAAATPKDALGGTALPPPQPAAVPAGNAMARSASPRDDAARVDRAVERAPSEGLLAVVQKGDIEAARTVLQTTDADAERDADGRTALAIAVLRADLPMVKLLLASGADRHAVDRFGHTPASYAHASGDTKLLQAFGRP